MNPITHALVGWCLAETAPGLGRRERAIITLAGISPDLDGFGAIPEILTRDSSHPLLWWTDYHHVFTHNLTFAIVVSVVSSLLARRRRLTVGLLAFVSVHLHLLGDLIGARGPDGYDWPIPYLYPFSMQPALSWSGQWALNAWPNIVITVVLLTATFVLAWLRGYSPIGFISRKADESFVSALRTRFGNPA